MFVETEHDGTLEIELFGPDAPLTVQRFLSLVDRRFFDGLRWHRVVPDFVVQTGDPRGDGLGVAPGAVRDEINRYSIVMLSLVSFNVLTGSYTLRFLAITLPLLLSSILSMRDTLRLTVVSIYIVYAILQWIFWLQWMYLLPFR